MSRRETHNTAAKPELKVAEYVSDMPQTLVTILVSPEVGEENGETFTGRSRTGNVAVGTRGH